MTNTRSIWSQRSVGRASGQPNSVHGWLPPASGQPSPPPSPSVPVAIAVTSVCGRTAANGHEQQAQ